MKVHFQLIWWSQERQLDSMKFLTSYVQVWMTWRNNDHQNR
jgi:hypothetical protein